jgi:uncharacterized protein YaiE (UPF0345 family)
LLAGSGNREGEEQIRELREKVEPTITIIVADDEQQRGTETGVTFSIITNSEYHVNVLENPTSYPENSYTACLNSKNMY